MLIAVKLEPEEQTQISTHVTHDSTLITVRTMYRKDRNIAALRLLSTLSIPPRKLRMRSNSSSPRAFGLALTFGGGSFDVAAASSCCRSSVAVLSFSPRTEPDSSLESSAAVTSSAPPSSKASSQGCSAKVAVGEGVVAESTRATAGCAGSSACATPAGAGMAVEASPVSATAVTFLSPFYDRSVKNQRKPARDEALR